MFDLDNIPDWFCTNCNSKNEIPLYCKECKIQICSACWLSHDVEMMKQKGLLVYPRDSELSIITSNQPVIRPKFSYPVRKINFK